MISSTAVRIVQKDTVSKMNKTNSIHNPRVSHFERIESDRMRWSRIAGRVFLSAEFMWEVRKVPHECSVLPPIAALFACARGIAGVCAPRRAALSRNVRPRELSCPRTARRDKVGISVGALCYLKVRRKIQGKM